VNAEINQGDAVETTLRETARRLNAVLSNASVSIFMMNEIQHCVYMNPAAERLTGFTLSETTGRPLHDVIHHTRPDGSHFPLSDCAIDRAFPENANTQGEEVFVHKDGHFYPVAFTASPMHDDDAKIVGTIIEVRDISEEKRNVAVRDLLIREVDHRARNILAMVQSLTRLTKAGDLDSYKRILSGRIDTMVRAQTSLADRLWVGGCLRDIFTAELESLCPEEAIFLEGPKVTLSPEQVQPLSMLFHELATNANKYGACSQAGGKITISWTIQNGELRLHWRETGGPLVTRPRRVGFGTRLTGSLANQLNGKIDRTWEPDGLSLKLVFPI